MTEKPPRRRWGSISRATDDELREMQAGLSSLTRSELQEVEDKLYKEMRERGILTDVKKHPKYKTDDEIVAEMLAKYGPNVSRGKYSATDKTKLKRRKLLHRLPTVRKNRAGFVEK